MSHIILHLKLYRKIQKYLHDLEGETFQSAINDVSPKSENKSDIYKSEVTFQKLWGVL